MISDIKTSIAILVGAGSLVALVQVFPPLTSFEAPQSQRPGAPAFDVDEFAFCQQNMPGTDCGCFADRAGQIMSEDNPRVAGWAYADKWDLALTQAGDSCS